MIRYPHYHHLVYKYSAQRISHGCSSSKSTVYKAQNFELKQAFTRYSASVWNCTQWGNYPVNCYCTQLLITFTVNVLHLTSSVISPPRDDGLLSSLWLPNKTRSISRSVTMWMFISWISYHLIFPFFQLIKRKKGYGWNLNKVIAESSSMPCRILILKLLSLTLLSSKNKLIFLLLSQYYLTATQQAGTCWKFQEYRVQDGRRIHAL